MAAKKGVHLRKRLDEMKEKYEQIGDVRGFGMLQAIELVEDRKSKTPACKLRDTVDQMCLKRGVITLGCGKSGIGSYLRSSLRWNSWTPASTFSTRRSETPSGSNWMRLYEHDAAPVLPGQGYSKRILIDELALGIPGSFLQEVEFKKGQRVRQHHHNFQTEIFYALDEAPFLINGIKVTMRPGDVLVCEPGRHSREPGCSPRLQDIGPEDRFPRK